MDRQKGKNIRLINIKIIHTWRWITYLFTIVFQSLLLFFLLCFRIIICLFSLIQFFLYGMKWLIKTAVQFIYDKSKYVNASLSS